MNAQQKYPIDTYVGRWIKGKPYCNNCVKKSGRNMDAFSEDNRITLSGAIGKPPGLPYRCTHCGGSLLTGPVGQEGLET